MYLQIKHKIQSEDPELYRDPSQSCRSRKESDSIQFQSGAMESYLPTASTILHILHCSHVKDCAFSGHNKILYKLVEPSFQESASSTSWQHQSDFKVTNSSNEHAQ